MAGDRFTCPYCGDPYGLAPGPCAPCFLKGCKRPATPPPAAPGPGEGDGMGSSLPREEGSAVKWRARALAAEAERDEARERNPYFRRYVEASLRAEREQARASAAEASLLALREKVRGLAEHMEKTARDAFDEEAVSIARDCASDLRAALGGDVGTGTGHEGGAR